MIRDPGRRRRNRPRIDTVSKEVEQSVNELMYQISGDPRWSRLSKEEKDWIEKRVRMNQVEYLRRVRTGEIDHIPDPAI